MAKKKTESKTTEEVRLRAKVRLLMNYGQPDEYYVEPGEVFSLDAERARKVVERGHAECVTEVQDGEA